MQANIRLGHELLAVEEQHDVHVMLELVVPEVPRSGTAPLRLALVVDRSGSMTGNALATVVRCGHHLVDRLGPADRMALVVYDDEVDLLAAMQPVAPGLFHALLDGITPGGMTNLSGGWLKGLEEAGRYGDGIRRVLLLTDGLANAGIVEPAKLTAIAESLAEEGVSTSTIGVGDGFAEELLTGMAASGRGSAWYAESVEDLPGIFAQEFDGLVALAAQNVSVEVRPGDDVAFVGALNDLPVTPVAGGVQVLLGDAFGGQRMRVVFRLHVPRLARLGLSTVAEIVLRYVSVGDEVAAHTVTLPVTVNAVTAGEAAAAHGDREVADEVTVLAAASAACRARRLADEGSSAEAAALLRTAVADLRRVAPRSERAAGLLQQADDLDRTVVELSMEAYGAASSKRLHYRARDLGRDRPGPR